MADAPSTFPVWAQDTYLDPTTSANNKLEPSEDFKLTGLNRNEDLTRPNLNYQFDLIDRWIENLDERTSTIGATYITTNTGQSQSTIEDRLGGTWGLASGNPGTIAGETVDVWIRSA